MSDTNKARIKGLIMIVTLSVSVGFIIWYLLPSPKLDIALLDVDITNQITEGETNNIVIDLKNNSKTEFNSNLSIKWIPDPNNGTPILIPLTNINLLGNATYSTSIDLKILSKHVSTYKKFISSKFQLTGDQNDKNNLIIKEINYYKKSQTNSIAEVLPNDIILPTKPFTIDYVLNGKTILKSFNSKAEFNKASIPKEIKKLKIDGTRTIDLNILNN